ncbi:MAG: CoA transferase [Gammaproteobacteria bacterium]
MPSVTPARALSKLWSTLELPEQALADVHLTGSDPILPSSFAVGTAAQVSISATALAAVQLWHMRTGRAQKVSVDMRHAGAEFRSERYLRVNGEPPPELWDPLSGLYRCGDGSWVRIHTNFPHHRAGIVSVLECEDSRDGVANALREWNGAAFEQAAAERGAIAVRARSRSEWMQHPQCPAVAALPLVDIRKIGPAPVRPLPPGERPLSGLRIMDLTRIIAGPVCGRALAAHGADVMRIGAEHLPTVETLVMDTGRGKRSAFVDLRDSAGLQILRELAAGADVLVQGFRPGALAALGVSPDAMAEVRPGLVYGSLSAYGQAGPWAGRRGFDSMVQTACGINDDEARAAGQSRPQALPCQALDHATGFFLAAGIITALRRRAFEGGSWYVQVSLARTAEWLYSLGRVEQGMSTAQMNADAVLDLLEDSDSDFGRLSAVRPAAQLSETPCAYTRPGVRPGRDAPAWSG